MDKLLQGVLIAVIILGSGYLVYSFVVPISDTPEVAEIVTPVDDVGGIDTSGWQTYRNEEYGFSFSYPPNWTLKVFEIDKVDFAAELTTDDYKSDYTGESISGAFIYISADSRGRNGRSVDEWLANDSYAIFQKQELVVDSVRAIQFGFDNRSEERGITSGQPSVLLNFDHEGTRYTFNYLDTDSPGYDMYFPEYQAIIDTIKVN